VSAGCAMLLGACGGGPHASPETFCATVGTVPVITTTDQLDGPQGQLALERLEDALRKLRSRSPSDIKGDVGTLLSVTSTLRGALRQAAEHPDDAAKESSDLQAPLAAFQSASDRIVRYTDDTCGIQLTER
jgi:hypothetical protein